MNLKKLLKKAPFALIASLVIVILLTMSVSAASNINDAAYQINMNVFNNITTDDHLDNQIASFNLNPQTYIDNYYLNSALTGVAIRDADGKDVIYMPPPTGSSNWSVYLPYTPVGVQDFKLYLSQENLNGNQVLMPGSTGITYNFSNISIDNDDSWRFDVEGLNVKEGSNTYENIVVLSSQENYIKNNIEADIISLGSNNTYYQNDNFSSNVVTVQNNTTGRIWYNEENGIYYNFKDHTLYQSFNALDWDILVTNNSFSDMYYNGNIFVAYRTYNDTSKSPFKIKIDVYYSTDGINFNTVNVYSRNVYSLGTNYNGMQSASLHYINGLFVIVFNDKTQDGESSRTYNIKACYSSNGINWSSVNIVSINKTTGLSVYSVTDNGNSILLTADSNYRLSSDGRTWNTISGLDSVNNRIVNIFEEQFIFDQNKNYYFKLTGLSASKITNFNYLDNWNAAFTINEKSYLLGNTYLLSTVDGLTWTQEGTNGPYRYIGSYNSNVEINLLFVELKTHTEQDVSLIKNNNTYSLEINGTNVGSINSNNDYSLTGSNNILTSDLVNYFKTVKFSLNESPVFEWNFSRDGTLYDSTGNGNNATVSYISTYSPNISITLSGFQPVNINQNNEGSEEGGGSSMIEPDEASITVIDTDSENWNRIPVFKELAKDLRNSDWPVDLVLSLVVVLIDMLLCFLIYRFTRNQLTSGIVALVLLGYFVIMGCIPLFALVTGIVAELAIMTKRKVISY